MKREKKKSNWTIKGIYVCAALMAAITVLLIVANAGPIDVIVCAATTCGMTVFAKFAKEMF